MATTSINRPTSTQREAANRVAAQIRARVRARQLPQPTGVPYPWYEFEADVHRMLAAFLPQCVLGNVRLFTPSSLGDRDFGLEVDNLLHVSHDNTDHLVFIESKNQNIIANKKGWFAQYDNGPKDVLKQINGHVKALVEYLEPISKNVSLKLVYYVVTSTPNAPVVSSTGSSFNADLYLVGYDNLIPHLTKRLGLDPQSENATGDPRRISQSPFLDLLRLGSANPHLGHPELSAAVRFVERCRRNLDYGLFKLFDPKPECWLINGSAGMGKSVLLAYAAAVLSSGYHLQSSVGGIGAYPATQTLERIGFDLSKGALAIAAHSQKQLNSLREWFEYFVREFLKADLKGDVHFRRPEFILFRDMRTLLTSRRPWAAVFLDEAHDLPDHAATTLKEASERLGFYLIAACDRHQRLRLAGSDARVIPGFNFTNKSKRLRQVYRNPAPIYMASLALMFRWFAKDGPKVVPTAAQLEECFGFAVSRLGSSSRLTIKSDAHPANGWRHTIARFDSAQTASALLRREKLSRDDVLWVRFSQEDPSFDYESLQRDFTYHNCRTEEAADLNDKYIKGQDYPVVVIEGFPGFMDRFDSKKAEDSMWGFRRELYLCSSRSTCFLFLICSTAETPEVARINEELDLLIRSISTPRDSSDQGNGTMEWSMILSDSSSARTMNEYSDAVQAAAEADLTAAEDTKPDKIEGNQSVDVETAVPTERGPSETSFIVDEPRKPTKPIANAYGSWPPEPHHLPDYKWVLLIDAPKTALEVSESLGVTVPEVLFQLEKRGLHPRPNHLIPLPVLRAIAFEFECYPAVSQEEYDSLTDGNAEGGEAASESQMETDAASETPAPPDPSLPEKPKSDESAENSGESAHSKRSRTATWGGRPRVTLTYPISVKGLAEVFGVKPFQVARELIAINPKANPNGDVARRTAEQIAHRLGFDVTR